MNVMDNITMVSTDKGLNGIYEMTKSFLNNVHHVSDSSLYDELNISITENSPFIKIYNEDKAKDWHFWAGYYSGMFACVVIGFIFIILLPVLILLYSFCKCCGNCGGNSRNKYITKSKMLAENILNIVLMLLSIFMLAGAICSFMSNERLYRSFSESETNNASGEVSHFIKNTKSTLVQYLSTIPEDLSSAFKGFNGSLLNSISDIPIQEDLTSALRKTDMYKDFQNIDDDLDKSCTDIDSLLTQLETIQTLSTDITSSINNFKRDVQAKVKRCDPIIESKCNNIKNSLGNIKLDNPVESNAIFKKKDKYRNALCIHKIIKTFDETLNKELNSTKENILKEVSNTMSMVEQKSTQIIDDIDRGKVQLEDMLNGASDSSQQYSHYVKYAYYTLIALVSIVLVIIFLNLLGSTLGLCSSSNHEVSKTSWMGSHVLCCNLVLIFIFSIIMLPATILFVLGGIVHVESCRGLEAKQNNTIIKLADALIKSKLNVSHFSLYESLDDCADNKGLINAFQLSGLIESQTNYKELITGEINAVDVILPSFPTDKFPDLTEFYKVLQQHSFTSQIGEIDKLNDTLNQLMVQMSATKGTAIDLEDDIRTLGGIQNQIVDLKQRLTKLDNDIGNFKSWIDASNLSEQKMTTLNATITGKIQDSIDDIKVPFKVNMTNQVIGVVDTELTKMYNEVGKCKPIYMLYMNFRVTLCNHIIRPLNIFWFTYGWSVVCFLPSTILIFILINLFRMKNAPKEDKELFNLMAYNNAKAPANKSKNFRSNVKKKNPKMNQSGLYENLTNEYTLDSNERGNMPVF